MPSATSKTLGAAGLALLAAAGAAHGADPKIADYLYNLGPGPVAANQIIKLDGSAVSNIQSGKDLVIALGAVGDSKAKDGFGISFTPGRSQFEAVATSLSSYADRKDTWARLWGNTTFSYAQNKLTKASAEYARSAWAIKLSYYLRPEEDPIVAARDAVLPETGACAAALTRIAKSQAALLSAGLSLKSALNLGPDDPIPGPAIAWLTAKANPGVVAVPPLPAELANLLPGIIERQAQTGAALDDPAKFAAELNACALKVQSEVKKKWNTSQLSLVLGEGRIRPVGGDNVRYSLGQHLSLNLAWAPPGQDNSLFNLTLRRVRNELDLDTLGKTAALKNTSIAALRYTYGTPGRDTYALAEVSNVKGNAGTLSEAAYKSAVGIDRKLAAGLWLELRYGRARISDGTKLENKALVQLKFSPDSTLDKEIK